MAHLSRPQFLIGPTVASLCRVEQPPRADAPPANTTSKSSPSPPLAAPQGVPCSCARPRQGHPPALLHADDAENGRRFRGCLLNVLPMLRDDPDFPPPVAACGSSQHNAPDATVGHQLTPGRHLRDVLIAGDIHMAPLACCSEQVLVKFVLLEALVIILAIGIHAAPFEEATNCLAHNPVEEERHAAVGRSRTPSKINAWSMASCPIPKSPPMDSSSS